MRPRPTREALRLLHEGTLAFAKMERNGVRIDRDRLLATVAETDAASARLKKELESTDVWRQWQRAYRGAANLDSTEQLADVLYNRMGVKCHAYTEKGHKPSTQEKHLLKTGLPFCAKYVERKKLEKTAGTFLKGILNHLCPDGRLRPSYSLHTTVSYRSSAHDPNAQNFPKRNPKMAKLVRPCFVASKGRRLIEIDYAGIEVRVSACYNKDPVLINYIEDESTDMHRDTACDLFFLSKDQVDKRTTRDWSKNRFVFPQFYGSVYFQCAPHIWEAVNSPGDDGELPELPNGLTVLEHLRKKGIKELGDCDPKGTPRQGTFERHVKSVEDSFWLKRFKVYTQWKKSWYEEYQRKGYFRSYTGFVFEWGAGDDDGGGRGGRLPKRNDVLNYAIQCSAFHCMLWSIIQTTKWLERNGMRSMIVGQIHDSVLIDAADDEVDELLSHLNVLMTQKLREHWDWIIVPMSVEFEVSEVDGTWAAQKVWTQKKGVWGPKE